MKQRLTKQIGLSLAALAVATAAAPSLAQSTGTSNAASDASGSKKNVVTAMGGNIDPFAGNIDPFAGNIDPFAGNIDPFAKNIDPFAGNIDPFSKNIDPFSKNIDPFGKNIDPFGRNIDPFAAGVDAFGKQAESSGSLGGGSVKPSPFLGFSSPLGGFLAPGARASDPYAGAPALTAESVGAFWNDFAAGWRDSRATLDQLAAKPTDAVLANDFATKFGGIVSKSEQFWGQRVQIGTGQNFKAGFADKIFAKYGVNLSNPASFAKLTVSQRNRLVFDWYDGLMAFTGKDQFDHWMRAINWRPSITKIQGEGARSLIGIMDGNIGIDSDLTGKVAGSAGSKTDVNGHGAAVASLILADHDGKGLQGIAPKAKLLAFNPFDDTGTASWDDVTMGIYLMKTHGASVINVSLGVRGSTFHKDWRDVFANSYVKSASKSNVFVIAAGNDSIAQTNNVSWQDTGDPAIILVGSVDSNEQISSFSNRPGSACLVTADGVCNPGARLADRFVVAPGELLLVSDGRGGTTRVSGTSFAAPLVSGAITLLHDRWNWLASYPDETAKIIFSTARDLGAPGVDEVYGNGMLDVEASQSPINFANLQIQEYRGNNWFAIGQSKSISQVRAERKTGNWEADSVYFSALERIGNTHRDFLIPMSSRLIGQKSNLGNSNAYFQSYITKRFSDWLDKTAGFSDVATFAVPNKAGWGFRFTSGGPETAFGQATRLNRLPRAAFQMQAPNGRFSFSAGQGEGARFLGGQRAFGLASDYDTSSGGVNPMLGFASGDAFTNVSYGVAKNIDVSVGYTSRRMAQANNLALTDRERNAFRSVDDYRANALNIRVQHQLSSKMSVSVDYTKLREKNGLLGVQSIEESDLGKGSASETITLGSNVDLPGRVQLAVSATAGRSNASGKNQALSTQGGVMSSAFAMAVTKQGVIGKKDTLRVSVAQPLHVERGKMAFTSIGVVDRKTGELGPIIQTFDIAEKGRRFTGEMIYAVPAGKGSEFSLFGRGDYRTNAATGKSVDGMVIGGRVKLAF